MESTSPTNPAAIFLSNPLAQSSCTPLKSSEANNIISSPSTLLTALATPLQTSTFWAPPTGLTLSAFRRPECTVRLTDADPAKVIHTEYELLDPSICRTLGHGASSTVRLAYRRCDGRPVAVKTIAKHDALGLWSKSDRWRLSVRQNISSPTGEESDTKQATTPRLDEVDVLTSLRGICPNVVQLLDVYETHQEVQLVLEYCEGGDLFDCIKRRRQLCLEHGLAHSDATSIQGNFQESEASAVARTLLNVLATLHSRHIVHRDIKPENILLEKEDCCTDGSQHVQVKITDFGLARILRHEEDDECAGESHDGVLLQASAATPESVRRKRSRAYSRVGSDYYTAPEVSMGLGYDTPVDMYSLGITLYVMLCGVPPTSPFIHDFFKPRTDSLSDGESSSSSDSESVPTSAPSSKSDMFPSELDISPQAQDLICKMIHPDPSFRITASDALKHEWITQHTTHEDTKATLLEETTESSMPSTERPRSLSIVETEALLRIPIQGSIHEIAPPVDPPSNSPTSRGADRLEAIEAPTPPTPSSDSKVSISLTLADVCSKLVPLADRQNHHKRHRNHRRHAHLNGDTVRVTSKKHHRNASDISTSVIGPVSKKKVRVESRASSPPHFLHQPPNSTCANNRIARRFNSPIPQGVQFVGPLLPQKNLAVKGAN